jgi:predicted flavoprotein YhiN
MDLSHLAARRPGAELSMRMNFLPGHEEQVRSLVRSRRSDPIPLAVIPGSSLPPKLCAFILEQCGLTAKSTLAEISEPQLKKLMDWITAFPVKVNGVRGFDTCQVSAGGVPIEEVDPVSMRSRRVLGLYLAGETLDVVGPCGGYNLQFAFSSGAAAGMAMAREN